MLGDPEAGLWEAPVSTQETRVPILASKKTLGTGPVELWRVQ